MNKKRLWMLAAILITICGIMTLSACSNNDNAEKTDTSALDNWQAGKTVTADAVEAFGGIDKCFAAEPIPDGVWARMQGKTYKENPYIGRDDLRHIRALHWDYDNQMHVGEMIVNVQIANRVATILRQLFDAKYPIQRMLLPDVYDADDETQMRDNNSSSFCYRAIAGSTKLSKHARGLAIDINTLYNPYYKDRATAPASFSPPLPRHIATAHGTSPTRLTTTTSVSVSSQRLVSNGAATGHRARTSSILNSSSKREQSDA